MANFTTSPGVAISEIDNTFLTGQPVQAGAAIIGPTVKGPVEVPILVTSYSEYQTLFGDTFISGGNSYSYLTSISAYNYFNYGGSSLLVTRVVSGSFTPAESTTIPTAIALTSASAVLDLTFISESVSLNSSSSFSVNGITFYFTGSNETNTTNIIYINTASFAASTVADYAVTSSDVFAVSSSIAPYSVSLPFISSSYSSPNITFTYIGSNGLTGNLNYITSGSTTTYFSGGTNTEAFILETIGQGIIMNSVGAEDSQGALANGTSDNVRWEITNSNTGSGTFNVLIRKGNDTTNQKSVLESFNGVNLDPTSPRYISKVIGDQTLAYDSVNNQMDLTGNFPNNSNYVRVKSVVSSTPNYFDANGIAISAYTSSIPINGRGTFESGSGTVSNTINLYDAISTNTQGLVGSDYNNMIALLSNAEQYQFNVIFAPGLLNDTHTSQVTSIISNTISRGDSLYVVDLGVFGSTLGEAVTQAQTRDTSYAATYWPWVRIIDPSTGKHVWTPASTVVPGVYANNDRISAPWFAPAGINRGGLSTVLQAEQKLSQGNRDELYSNNINPIATLPKQGVVIFGQKTLQKSASSLDRVNVRRLMIELKSYIRQIADTVVFEQNTIATRNSFMARVTPFLEGIQQKQGLYAYKVVMDDSNNGPDVIDRNQLIGQIYIQPTRTAEFISLDFILQPTGAEFPG
jgi:uncharacterized protein